MSNRDLSGPRLARGTIPSFFGGYAIRIPGYAACAAVMGRGDTCSPSPSERKCCMRTNVRNIKLVPILTPVEVRRTQDLTTLAAAIQKEVKGACDSFRTGLLHAKRAGELLAKAKALCLHGSWLPWLTDKCGGISERTAQVYIQIADGWDEIEAKAQRITDLTINAARKLLSEPAADNDGKPTAAPVAAHGATQSETSPNAEPPKATPIPGDALLRNLTVEVDGPAAAPTQPNDDVPPPTDKPSSLLYLLNAIVQRLALSIPTAHEAEHPAECATAIENIAQSLTAIRKVLPNA
jgi:hypothetical protein